MYVILCEDMFTAWQVWNTAVNVAYLTYKTSMCCDREIKSERECENVCVCMCVWEAEIVCVCVYERERESVCVCLYVYERERVCVCVCVCMRERECVCKFIIIYKFTTSFQLAGRPIGTNLRTFILLPHRQMFPFSLYHSI